MRCAARIALFGGLLALGLYQSFRPTFESGFARIQTERGDGMLNHYILENSWKAISDPLYPGTLFSPPCFYPERYTIWYSEHLFGVAPAYWLLRLGLPHDLAYPWWQIAMAALDFIAFAAAARWLGVSLPLALLGAYLWGFALVNVYQLRHQQMIPRFWMPLAAYYGWSFVQLPSTRALNRMLACVFFQCIICMNTGWFLIGGLAVFMPVAASLLPAGVKTAAGFIARNRPRVAGIVGGWGLALVLAFLPYVIVNWGISRSYWECRDFMPSVAAWISGPSGSCWSETLAAHLPAVPEDCLLFCGFGLPVLAFVAAAHLYVAVRRPDFPPALALAAASLITAVSWLVITLTPTYGGHSLWEVVRLIPGGQAIRNVARVYTIVYLFATLGGIVWLSAVTARLKPLARWLVPGTIAAVIIFEQTGYEPKSFERADFYPLVDRLAGQLRGAEAGYMVVEPFDLEREYTTGIYGEALAMWVGLRAEVPVVNGYSGRLPRGFPTHRPASDDDLRAWLNGKFRGKLTVVPLDRPEAKRTLVIE